MHFFFMWLFLTLHKTQAPLNRKPSHTITIVRINFAIAHTHKNSTQKIVGELFALCLYNCQGASGFRFALPESFPLLSLKTFHTLEALKQGSIHHSLEAPQSLGLFTIDALEALQTLHMVVLKITAKPAILFTHAQKTLQDL